MAVYGVATNNPFALLDEDEDSEQHPEVPTEKSKTTESPPVRGKSARGRGTGRGGRGRDAPSRETVQEDVSREAVKVSQPHRVSRPRGRAAPVKGKRQYDRHDGTGRGHEFEKRHGGGKGNWGVSGEVEFPQEQTATGWDMPEESTQELPPQDGEVEGETGEGAEAGEPEKTEIKQEEKPKFTLAEYEEMMKDKPTLLTPVKKEIPAVDKKQFDGMAVLKKAQEESGFEGLEVERRAKKKERREKEVETVEVAFWVGDRPRGRGGRGGRGRGRGRSRDFDREGDGSQKRINGAGGSSDLTRADSTGHTPSFRGRGRGRGHGRSRGSYGDQVTRVSGVQGDSVYENAFPSLTG